jgi:hypothetical protein
MLDIPRAHVYLEHLAHRAAHLGLIPKAVADEVGGFWECWKSTL